LPRMTIRWKRKRNGCKNPTPIGVELMIYLSKIKRFLIFGEGGFSVISKIRPYLHHGIGKICFYAATAQFP